MSPMRGGRAVLASTLAIARVRQPYVIWGAEPMNGGNFLYLWATAWARRRATGVEWRVRHKPKMDPWLAEFPALQALTVDEADVRWNQRRTVEWGQQTFVDFDYRDLLDFSREHLLASDRFRSRIREVDRTAIVVNVRRGDYYRNPEFAARYGFDIASYVRTAVARLPIETRARFVLVSDDVDWCRTHLRFLEDGGSVGALPTPHDMFQDLAQLAGARHLVLANSTFSYWGGYMASALPPEERARSIQAPLHMNRLYLHGDSPLLLPQWRAIPEDEYTPSHGTPR